MCFRPITDFNEITSHFIECIYVHFYHKRIRVLALSKISHFNFIHVKWYTLLMFWPPFFFLNETYIYTLQATGYHYSTTAGKFNHEHPFERIPNCPTKSSNIETISIYLQSSRMICIWLILNFFSVFCLFCRWWTKQYWSNDTEFFAAAHIPVSYMWYLKFWMLLYFFPFMNSYIKSICVFSTFICLPVFFVLFTSNLWCYCFLNIMCWSMRIIELMWFAMQLCIYISY